MEQRFEDILREQGVVRNEPAMQIMPDNEVEHGRLILTKKQLFFARNVNSAPVFSKYFVNDQQLESAIAIDLDTINTIAQETYLVDTNILAITYLQYEAVKFSVISYEDWETDIQRTRMTPDIPGDPNKITQEI